MAAICFPANGSAALILVNIILQYYFVGVLQHLCVCLYVCAEVQNLFVQFMYLSVLSNTR